MLFISIRTFLFLRKINSKYGTEGVIHKVVRLTGFYEILTLVGYLIPNSVYTYILNTYDL